MFSPLSSGWTEKRRPSDEACSDSLKTETRRPEKLMVAVGADYLASAVEAAGSVLGGEDLRCQIEGRMLKREPTKLGVFKGRLPYLFCL